MDESIADIFGVTLLDETCFCALTAKEKNTAKIRADFNRREDRERSTEYLPSGIVNNAHEY